MTNKSPEDLLAFARQCQDLAATYAAKANVALTEYADLVEAGQGIGSLSSTSGNSGKSLIAWAEWLAENGPALRQKVWDGTGVNLTPKGLNQTREWRAVMAMWDDDALPADKVMKIPGNCTAAGRPPMIYFLWPQRFDVHALFGVGPSYDPRPVKAMTGVIQPPDGTVSMTEVRDANGWPQQAWDFYGDIGSIEYETDNLFKADGPQSNEDGGDPDG